MDVYGEIYQDVQAELFNLPFNKRSIEEKYELLSLIVEPEYEVDDEYNQDIDAMLAGEISVEEFYRKYFGDDAEFDNQFLEVLNFLKENGY